MTLRRTGENPFTIFCDVGKSSRCEDMRATDHTGFSEAIAQAKGWGWRVFRLNPGPGYMHVCPNCPTPR